MIRAYAYKSTCWKTVRKRALERDNNTCQICFNPDKPVYVHHIKPKNEGGPDMLDNAITVCNECHWNEHRSMRRKDIELGKCPAYTVAIAGNVDANTAEVFKELCSKKGITPSAYVRQLIQQATKESKSSTIS